MPHQHNAKPEQRTIIFIIMTDNHCIQFILIDQKTKKKMVTFQNFGKNEIKEKKFFAHFNCQDEMPIINSIYTL